MRHIFIAIGLMTPLVVLTTPGATGASGAGQPVPFKATYRGTAQLLDARAPLGEKIAANGSASSLGASRLRSRATVGQLNPGGCQPFTGTGRLTAPGRGWLIYSYAYAPCFRPTPPHAVLQGTFTIKSGGRALLGARGSGTYLVRFRNNQSGFAAPPGSVTITFSGTLSLPSPPS